MKRLLKFLAAMVFLTGCAGMQRSCSSCSASNFGSDWLIVQFAFDGKPINCWKLANVSVTNEPQSDGIYWQATNRNLIHISGWYNMVQVVGASWDDAAESLGVDLDQCPGGKYLHAE